MDQTGTVYDCMYCGRDTMWEKHKEGCRHMDLSGALTGFVVKDSGKRQEFTSGMVRDVTEGKTDYTLVFDGPMLERWAEHLTKGAVKYEARNWLKASGAAELTRFRESAARHFVQWMKGDVDEDHAAGCYFNINGYEHLLATMKRNAE